MLLVPYSSTIEVMVDRNPVRRDATPTTVITPTTIPSTVRTLRNLFERMASNAIRIVSFANMDGSFMGSVLGQSHYRIKACGFDRRIDSGDHADPTRDDQ